MLCRTLRHFNTSSDEYSVVFASNCTAALRLVAENFQFIESRSCVLRDRGCVTSQPACNVDESSCLKCPSDSDISKEDEHLYSVSKALCDVQTDTCWSSTDSGSAASDDDSVGCKNHSIPPVSCCLWNGEPIIKPTFLYVDDNHTSVIGMRGVAAHRGAEFRCIPAHNVDAFLSSLQQSDVQPSSSEFITHEHSRDVVSSASAATGNVDDAVKPPLSQLMTTDMPMSTNHCSHIVNCLFAYPAQSNFSGCRYPLEWVETLHRWSGHDSSPVNKTRPRCESKTRPRWYVLLDAAALLTTSTLDLRRHKPDFVTLSFYKMFGFPTGLGMSLLCILLM